MKTNKEASEWNRSPGCSKTKLPVQRLKGDGWQEASLGTGWDNYSWRSQQKDQREKSVVIKTVHRLIFLTLTSPILLFCGRSGCSLLEVLPYSGFVCW